MNIWRPAPSVRVKSLGLHWRSERLLAMEVLNDAGEIKGVRPLGGSIEFGERWQDALIREFQEELNIEVTVSGNPLITENIYTHEGVDGHEVLFIAEVIFPVGAYDSVDEIVFSENNGEKCTARWFDLARLDYEGIELYPPALKEHLLISDQGVVS